MSNSPILFKNDLCKCVFIEEKYYIFHFISSNPSDGDLQEFTDFLVSIFKNKSDTKLGIVYKFHKICVMMPRQIKIIMDGLNSVEDEMENRLVASAIIIDNVCIRKLVGLVASLLSKKKPVDFFNTVSQGLDFIEMHY